jgi:hypothetical protein
MTKYFSTTRQGSEPNFFACLRGCAQIYRHIFYARNKSALQIVVP